MNLSSDLISQFVKFTKDDNNSPKESTMYGTVVYDGRPYVKLNGSDQLTPVSTTTDVKDGDRVTVMIKDHTATITGNTSSPAARTDDVKEMGSKISEFEIIIAYRVSTEDLEAAHATIETLKAKIANFKDIEAVTADIETLQAKFANLTHVTATDVEALNADIENIRAQFGDFTDISADELDAINAEIDNLRGYTADYTYVSAEVLDAVKASIENLETKKLSADEAAIKYANIDFSNINKAAVKKIFTDSGIIGDLTVSEGKITGTLVGVTIKGDLIEGGTIKADKLVVKGSDGIYYKLNVEGGAPTSEKVTEEDLQNGLSGSIIVAKSITAEKVSVDDLVAFGATIGGFHITNEAIYSGVKESATNTTRGVYLDREGQAAFGDDTNFMRYYETTDEDGNAVYKLEISADDISFGSEKKSIETAMDEVNQSVNEHSTSFVETCEQLIFSAMERYVETGDYEEFKSAVESRFSILADEISMSFTTATDQITNVDGDLQAKFTQLYKYISFSDEGIKIGSGNNAITLRVDNDMIVFEKNGVQFGYWDGNDFYTGNIVVRVNERAQFGNFAFVPRSDGSLMFLKVGDS